ncbi:MAG: M50 family metallopeptidase [Candidatus Gastranaerophilaceae bacterium]
MNVLIMIILIGFLVMIHELGHFLAAKAFGMKVDRFGFGLPVGPTLFRKKIGETEFVVHALLLGGYVSFPDDDANSTVAKDSYDRFNNRPVYQRIIVISAGVIANFVCAIVLVLFCAGFWQHLPSGSYEVSVSKIMPDAVKSVKNSGIQKGDVIYSINGTICDSPLVLTRYLSAGKTFDGFVSAQNVAETFANLKRLNPSLNDKTFIKTGTQIVLPERTSEVPLSLSTDQIYGFEKINDSDVELTEFQKTLRDLTVGQKTYTAPFDISLEDLAKALSDTYHSVNIIVIRNGEKVALNPVYPDSSGVLGIEKRIKENMYSTKNIKDIFKYSFVYLKKNSDMMLYGLGKIFTGKVPVEEMHGIVAITKIGGDIIRYQGLFKGLLLTAIISLNLAYLNFLPIPALDGGHFVFLVIEKITGKPLNEKVIAVISDFFFYLLIVFMIFIIFNDVAALITNKI